MGMGFAKFNLASSGEPPASQNHFNHWSSVTLVYSIQTVQDIVQLLSRPGSHVDRPQTDRCQTKASLNAPPTRGTHTLRLNVELRRWESSSEDHSVGIILADFFNFVTATICLQRTLPMSLNVAHASLLPFFVWMKQNVVRFRSQDPAEEACNALTATFLTLFRSG